jgi:hypothetical protein
MDMTAQERVEVLFDGRDELRARRVVVGTAPDV